MYHINFSLPPSPSLPSSPSLPPSFSPLTLPGSLPPSLSLPLPPSLPPSLLPSLLSPGLPGSLPPSNLPHICLHDLNVCPSYFNTIFGINSNCDIVCCELSVKKAVQINKHVSSCKTGGPPTLESIAHTHTHTHTHTHMSAMFV